MKNYSLIRHFDLCIAITPAERNKIKILIASDIIRLIFSFNQIYLTGSDSVIATSFASMLQVCACQYNSRYGSSPRVSGLRSSRNVVTLKTQVLVCF